MNSHRSENKGKNDEIIDSRPATLLENRGLIPSPEGIDKDGNRVFYTMPRTKRHIDSKMKIPRFSQKKGEEFVGVTHLSDTNFLKSRQNSRHLLVDVKDRERRKGQKDPNLGRRELDDL